MWRGILLFFCLLSVVTFWLFFLDLELARWIQSYLGYYLCTAALVFSGYHCFKAKSVFLSLVRANRKRNTVCAVTIAVLGTYLIALHEPQQMRVFNDEPTHALTAQAMAQERAVHSPQAAYFESGGFVYSKPNPVYRLYLYPYLVSIVHNLTGVRLANFFVVNVLVCFGLLIVGFYLGWLLSKGSILGGCAAQVLLLGLPLLHQVINSVSYDPLNLFLFASYIAASLLYLRDGGQKLLNVTISLGILLAYCRSESILYLLAIAVLFLIRSIQERKFTLSLYSVISPLFLIAPLAARQIGVRLSESLPEYYEHVETGFFSLIYLRRNTASLFDWLFSIDPATLNSILISGLTVLVMGIAPFYLKFFKTERKDKPSPEDVVMDRVLLTFVGLVCVHLFIILCLYWNPTEASAVRFFLPITLVFVLLIIRMISKIEKSFTVHAFRWLILVAGSFVWFVTLPKAARSEATQSSYSSTNANRILAWAQLRDNGRTLYAVKSAGNFVLNQIPATSLRGLSRHPEVVSQLVGEGYYDEVILFESTYFNPSTNTWTQTDPKMPIDPKLVLERIAGWRGFLQAQTEVYRLVGLRQEDGTVSTIGEMSEAKSDWSTDREYFDHIRALQRFQAD
ncbi:MAG: hypothetical protein GVY36_12205 [Verrucomicrobia bacterium]|jgi:hypothetical protein|nr:hypothetical protein [Verrucomicrobiota bacterium]